MWILIPAYEPDARLIGLVATLRPAHPVLVVDDGSGPAFAEVFDACDALGAEVLRHPDNRGKAAALRTGFAWLEDHAPGHAVVCADSDGQHRPEDIARVGAELARRAAVGEDDAMLLGVRAFEGDVPLRSRAGNRATTALVAAVAGTRISDTQTGLRGYPPGLLGWAREVPGERFAYELRLLLDGARRGIPIVEVPIATVYLDHNASSHFRPLVDSLKVMAPLLAFGASSLVAFAVDTAAVLALTAAGASLLAAVVVARVASAGLNFTLNRTAVFRAGGPVAPQVARYAALALAILAGSYLGVRALTGLGMPLLAAKIVTDATLYLVSYGVQRAAVFSRRDDERRGAPHRRHASAARPATTATASAHSATEASRASTIGAAASATASTTSAAVRPPSPAASPAASFPDGSPPGSHARTATHATPATAAVASAALAGTHGRRMLTAIAPITSAAASHGAHAATRPTNPYQPRS
ncbi:glycosyltransferase family 2 protein [Demequina pelophila]|uniref:glycosyltransferase family 2 protein n=1 Tax=Demequina pelophila TaxID=1638984 RepID=UPI000ABC9957|nr:glycosyltransferase family 2 protein [Demequina pelophila]